LRYILLSCIIVYITDTIDALKFTDILILLPEWGNTILRKTITFIFIFLVWYFLAFLTLGLVAEAEAPIKEVEEEVIDLPHFKIYAYKQVREIFGVEHWEYVDFIVRKESSWDNEAQNPTSTAFGYFQTLIGTEKHYGCIVRSSNPNDQIDCGLKYIKQRYGTPYEAYLFWQKNHWY